MTSCSAVVHQKSLVTLLGQFSHGLRRILETFVSTKWYVTLLKDRLSDRQVLREEGVTNFDKYCMNLQYKDELYLDYFLDPLPGYVPNPHVAKL